MASQAVSSGNDTPIQATRTPGAVTYNGKQYSIAKEGTAEILELQHSDDGKASKEGERKSQSVFYNPVQQYNRDISVLAIKVFGEDLASIRRARHQRRIDQLAKGGQRGKKRKRPQKEEGSNEGDVGARKGKAQEQSAAVNGTSNGVLRQPDESGAGHQAQPSPNPIERQETFEGNDCHTEHAIEPIPDGPRGGMDGTIPPSQSPFRILDALSATGLRALRYAREIPMITSVTANDLSASAIASIKLNVEHNKLADKIVPSTSDAVEHMHHAASHGQRLQGLYQVIDLDPYGTAAPFLDAAVQAIVDGGLLCVTCTDAGVFASVGYLEKTYSQYGGLPLKGPHAHEGGLRLILHAIATSAARYGLAIEPLLSLSIDFYARIFVRVHRSPVEVKFLASKTMVVYSCDTGCGAWTIQHLARPNKREAKNGDTIYTFTSAIAPSASTNCEHCGFKTHQAGPMWGGPLHNPHFIQRILDMLPTLDKSVYGTIPRIEGMLSVALNETLEDTTSVSSINKPSSADRHVPPLDPAIRSQTPFFFLPSSLSRILHCVSPSDAAIRGALLHLGYRVTRSHTKAGSICTDAPWSVIWEIMREWIRQKSPVKEGALKERTAGWGIMQKDRSKMKLNEAKEMFRQVTGNSSLENLSDLKRDMEAALYRVSKLEEDPKETEGQAISKGMDDKTDEGGHENDTEKEGTPNNRHEKTQEHANTSTTEHILPHQLEIVFDEALGKEPQGKRIVRYQANPRPDWGPMNRAKGGS